MISEIIVAALGIASTVIAYRLNPRAQVHRRLDEVFIELDHAYVRRDHALETNDSDALRVALDDICRLREEKDRLFQRLAAVTAG